MTIEEQGCPCLETSEPSNVSSMATDVSSIINSSEMSDVSTRPPPVHTNNDCVCKPNEKLSASPRERGASSPNYGQPPPANHQPQRGGFQPSTQFEPAMQCLCHAYRVKQFVLPEKYDERNAARRQSDNVEHALALPVMLIKKPYAEDDVAEGIPRKKYHEFENDEDGDPKKYIEAKRELEEITERIDIYYFDHGNSAYYRTTDSPPVLATEKCAEKTDNAATRFWAEIFGTVHIGIAFVTAFILQLLRFVLFSIVRPLTVGIIQLFADYFVKPLLSIFFNAIIQPILILLYNIATSFRDLCEPIAEAFGFFLREIAAIVRAFRIVEINRNNNQTNAACT